MYSFILNISFNDLQKTCQQRNKIEIYFEKTEIQRNSWKLKRNESISLLDIINIAHIELRQIIK